MTKKGGSTTATTLKGGEPKSDWLRLSRELSRIWSQATWDREAKRIELAYWQLIKDKVPHVRPPKVLRPTEHRIEAFVRKLARQTGIGNLHVGLTSSDLEDNIRALRLEKSLWLLRQTDANVWQAVEQMPDVPLTAYTHLLRAGVTSKKGRFYPTLMAPNPIPIIVRKGIGGAIGTQWIQGLMGVHDINRAIFPGKYTQSYSHQTGDHTTEFNAAAWITRTAALNAKIANDFRLMYALGQAEPKYDDTGSTAIPGKKPNPWRFESAAGKAKLLFCLPGQVADIMSDCLLERTLTNQAPLNRLFERGFKDLLGVQQQLTEAIDRTHLICDVEPFDESLHTEEQMLKLIMQGVPREDAHKKIHDQKG